MSSDPPRGPLPAPAGRERTLGEWIEALVAAVDSGDPAAAGRLRRIAGRRRARIRLDAETVLVRFRAGALRVRADDPAAVVDGSGGTDRATVAGILRGRVDAVEAVLDGRVEAAGAPDAVAAMFAMIEVILDAAARVPALQELARELLRGVPASGPPDRDAGAARVMVERELRLLAALDLLRDEH